MSRARTDTPGTAETPDVLVLGGGAAGLCAAVAARRAGASVVVLKKTEGATALSSGAVDVADADKDLVPGPTASPLARGPTLEESMARLVARRPRHPYARLSTRERARMPEALALLEEIAAPLELVGAGAREHNLVVATQLGTVKRTARVQRSQAFDLASLDEGARVAVLELEDLAGYDGAPVAKVLSWVDALTRGSTDENAGRRFEVVTVPAAADAPLAASPRDFAAMLDDDDAFVTRVARALEVASADEPFACALLPPVLGLGPVRAGASPDERRPLAARLSEAAGVPVVEVLALPQSAPGQRLSAALVHGAERAGVLVKKADARSSLLEGGRVLEVRAKERGEDVLYRPGAVVLATGRFLAGGLVRDGYAIEPVFGLPLFSEGALIGDRFIAQLTAERPEGEHAIFRAGVGYDEELRPWDERGEVAAQNLFAAGSILEGYDPARDGSGLGVAALTGLVAGERAAAALGSLSGSGRTP